jgi:glycosyltransferase involved in cell wall biosynthesis
MRTSAAISIIIPVYNGERYLAEAIESILAQTYQPVEVIVVDDGSTDKSASIARQFGPPVRCFAQANAGIGAARNHGVELAQGIFLAFLDADDLWMKDKLTLQMAALQANSGLEAVFGHVRQFYSPEVNEDFRRKVRCDDNLIPGNLPAIMLITRQAFNRIGWFETNWKIGGDVSWILHAREKGLRSCMLPDLIYLRRIHPNNNGITQRQFIQQRIHILKNALDRRRQVIQLAEEKDYCDQAHD